MYVHTVNAFAKTKQGGNPAGVVIGQAFSDVEMQKIAKMVGFSETAFVEQINSSDFKIRFFTPCAEVELCGHATIAAFSLLRDKSVIKTGLYNLKTKIGIINIKVENKNIFMTQDLPKFYEKISRHEIMDCLNIDVDDLIEELPTQIVSTGLRDILVPIKELKVLTCFNPNYKKITALSQKYNVIGIHAFSLESKFGATAHCRNFAPLYGIPEESATGTSNGALACYLYKYGVISKEQASDLLFEQGYSMGRPSEISVKLEITDKQIDRVSVGGSAVIGQSKDLILA